MEGGNFADWSNFSSPVVIGLATKSGQVRKTFVPLACYPTMCLLLVTLPFKDQLPLLLLSIRTVRDNALPCVSCSTESPAS